MTYPDKISPKLLTPRKNLRQQFDEAKIKALAENIRTDGMHVRILARPKPSTLEPSQATSALPKPGAPIAEQFEIIDGECRVRAALLLGLEEVPVDIKEMTDRQATEVHFVIFLHRTDLTPLEEARGFAQMLEMPVGDCEPAYTLKALAEKLHYGEAKIRQSLLLLCTPEAVQQAVEDGRMAPEVAALIGRIPGKTAREAAAQTLLNFNQPGANPHKAGTAATREQAREYIRTQVYRDLRTAPFEKELSYLSTELTGGVTLPLCGKCPQRSGNQPDALAGGSPEYLCMQPDCFNLKAEINWRAKAGRTPKTKGARVLSFVESAEIYPAYLDPGQFAPKAMGEWADLSAKPQGFIKTEILPEKMPTWAEILGKWVVPENICLARDQAGKVRLLMPLDAALEAAKKKSPDLFTRKPKMAGYKKPDDSFDESKAGTTSIESTTKHEFSEEFSALRDAVCLAICKKGPCGAIWTALAVYFEQGILNGEAEPDIKECCAVVIKKICEIPGGENESLEFLKELSRIYGVDWEKHVEAEVAATAED